MCGTIPNGHAISRKQGEASRRYVLFLCRNLFSYRSVSERTSPVRVRSSTYTHTLVRWLPSSAETSCSFISISNYGARSLVRGHGGGVIDCAPDGIGFERRPRPDDGPHLRPSGSDPIKLKAFRPTYLRCALTRLRQCFSQ